MSHSTPFFDDSNRIRTTAPKRFWIFVVTILIIAAIFLSRGFYLQIVHGSSYRSQAERNRVTPEVIPAPRGIFYDAHDKQLVENISSTDLVVDPVTLPQEEDEAYVIETLPKFIPSLTPEEVREAIDKARSLRREILLTKALEHDTVIALEQAQDSLHGIKLASSLVRKYLFPISTAHVLGYTSAVTAEELSQEETLLPTDTTGKLGLEQTYDDSLRGKHGVSYLEVNAAGKPLIDLGKEDPTAGKDLHLTLDIDLQEYIYTLFSDRDQKQQAERKEKTNGAAVVMNPQTGEVLALVSYPSFDPNVFSQPALRKQAKDLFTDERQPLFNRAINGTYPSGSVIKPFIAAGGLQEGVITDKTSVLSTGGITIGPWHFFDWKAGGHGATNVKKAIAESVNTFFYLLAGGDETHAGLGVEKIATYLEGFGWAKQTGIDLPSEAAGFIPTPDWKEKTFHERWYIGDTYHLGIGQGNVLVTPVQIAAGTSALANGKTWYTPHLLKSEAAEKRSLPVTTKNIQIVREGMRQAVTDGSARSLSTLPIALAGKTGTAQIGGSENTHAWFTSFGPYEEPQLVVTILLEKGGAGDADAVPMAKEIWQWWIDHQNKAD